MLCASSQVNHSGTFLCPWLHAPWLSSSRWHRTPTAAHQQAHSAVVIAVFVMTGQSVTLCARQRCKCPDTLECCAPGRRLADFVNTSWSATFVPDEHVQSQLLQTTHLSCASRSFSAVLRSFTPAASLRRRRAISVRRFRVGVPPSNTNTGRTRWNSSLQEDAKLCWEMCSGVPGRHRLLQLH